MLHPCSSTAACRMLQASISAAEDSATAQTVRWRNFSSVSSCSIWRFFVERPKKQTSSINKKQIKQDPDSGTSIPIISNLESMLPSILFHYEIFPSKLQNHLLSSAKLRFPVLVKLLPLLFSQLFGIVHAAQQFQNLRDFPGPLGELGDLNDVNLWQLWILMNRYE